MYAFFVLNNYSIEKILYVTFSRKTIAHNDVKANTGEKNIERAEYYFYQHKLKSIGISIEVTYGTRSNFL